MTRRRLLTFLAAVLAVCLSSVVRDGVAAAAEPKDRKLRIIAFGAHPDDAELKVGGTAIKWAQQGHQVKLVSVTNGDVGHWQIKGEELARRRLAEVQAADKVLGVETDVLPIHDGELEPTLENRRTITRLIREWQADIVLCHRPCDYHPDHRYVGVLVQDAAFMVTVPFFCPETPALKENPVFLYLVDGFQKPAPFHADIVVAIDDVFDRKLDALHELESQFYEGGAGGSTEYIKPVPPNSEVAARKQWLRETRWARLNADVAKRFRDKLAEEYGPEGAKSIKYAEAFELCEYGRQPGPQELMRLFPISLGNPAAKP